MNLPNTQSEDSLVLWKKEIIRLKEALEAQFGVTITEDDIRAAIRSRNDVRRAMKRFYSLSKLDPVPMDRRGPVQGPVRFHLPDGPAVKENKLASDIDDIIAKIMTEYETIKLPKKAPYPGHRLPLGRRHGKDCRRH